MRRVLLALGFIVLGFIAAGFAPAAAQQAQASLKVVASFSILGDLVKSAEPGIAVAEGKVGFWDVCESLVYSRGEIIVRRVALSSPLRG